LWHNDPKSIIGKKMNYKKIYESIILRARTRGDVDGYRERHHIIPKSMGGSDCNENMVNLTAREHFIAHWLLAKIHKNSQMLFALFAMTKPGNDSQKRYTSHSFKYAREKVSKFLSETRSGELHPLFGVKGERNPNFGSKRNEEQKANISKARKGMSGKKNGKSRMVKNLDTGEVFDSIRIAQSKTTGNVSYAARFGGTAGGCRYAIIEENGNEIKPASELKGFMSGGRHVFSKRVINDTTGEEFQTIKSAAESVGKTPSAISWAIKNNRAISGNKFRIK
jgi:hypothetical protein